MHNRLTVEAAFDLDEMHLSGRDVVSSGTSGFSRSFVAIGFVQPDPGRPAARREVRQPVADREQFRRLGDDRPGRRGGGGDGRGPSFTPPRAPPYASTLRRAALTHHPRLPAALSHRGLCSIGSETASVLVTVLALKLSASSSFRSPALVMPKSRQNIGDDVADENGTSRRRC